MIRSALLGMGFAAAMATTAAAQPYYYPGYSYYSYPWYSYPAYGYPYTSWSYGWPSYYAAPAYRPAPAYSDPYVTARPYSDSAGPRASGRVGY
jgi:hypothetical protein